MADAGSVVGFMNSSSVTTSSTDALVSRVSCCPREDAAARAIRRRVNAARASASGSSSSSSSSASDSGGGDGDGDGDGDGASTTPSPDASARGARAMATPRREDAGRTTRGDDLARAAA
jgi:hypothetical protein